MVSDAVDRRPNPKVIGILIALALAGGVALAVVRSGVDLPPHIAAYIDGLRSGDYDAAYRASSLPDQHRAARGGGPTSALGAEHFAAFWRADPADEIEVTYEPNRVNDLDRSREMGVLRVVITRVSGARQELRFSVAQDDLFPTPVTLAGIDVRGGPLPSLAIDGVAIQPRAIARPDAGLLGLGLSRYTYLYSVNLLSGRHILDIGAGPATRAEKVTIEAERSEGLRIAGREETVLSLRPSRAGIAASKAAAGAWLDRCGNACRISSCSGPFTFGFDQSLLVPRTVRLGTGRLVGTTSDVGSMPQNGWAIAVAGTADARRTGPFAVPTFVEEEPVIARTSVSFIVYFSPGGGAAVEGICE